MTTAADADEAAQNALREADAGRQIARDVKYVPHGLILRDHLSFFEELPDGGMMLQFIPCMTGPNGEAVGMAPDVRVHFSKDGWEKFQRTVAADGVRPPTIETALIVPT